MATGEGRRVQQRCLEATPSHLHPPPHQATACRVTASMWQSMALWRVALLPGSPPGRVRWLACDGRFTVAAERALTVVDPETAARRLQLWLATHGRDPVLLHRLQLLPVTHSNPPG